MRAWNIRGCRVEVCASILEGCVEIREIWADGQVAQLITLPLARYDTKGFLPSGNVQDVADALVDCAAEIEHANAQISGGTPSAESDCWQSGGDE